MIIVDPQRKDSDEQKDKSTAVQREENDQEKDSFDVSGDSDFTSGFEDDDFNLDEMVDEIKKNESN